jgi:copper transport protein
MKLSTWRSALAWALFVLIVVSPRALEAHARLTRSAPGNNEHVAQSPTQLRLWFSETPQLALTRVTLLAADSAVIVLGPLTASGEMSVTVTIAKPLSPGAYTVVWRVAAADGHPASGRLRFVVGVGADGGAMPAGIPGDDTSSQRRDTLPRGTASGNAFIVPSRDTSAMVSGRAYVGARWMELVALLASIGAVTFRFGLAFVVRQAGARSNPSDVRGEGPGVLDAVLRLFRPMLVLMFVANLIRLGGEWQLVQRQGTNVTMRALLGTGWGHGWLLGVSGVVLAGIGAAVAKRLTAGWAIAGTGVLFAALAPAITGHAIASPEHRTLAVTADLLHVLGGGAWLGTLLIIVLAVLPALRDQDPEAWGSRTSVLLTAFSPIALTGAAVVLASGVVSAWLRLGSFPALWQTPYGNVLLVKTALAVTIGMIGAWNWRAMQPALASGASPTRIRKSAATELVTAGLLLIATAILIALPTPV